MDIKKARKNISERKSRDIYYVKNKDQNVVVDIEIKERWRDILKDCQMIVSKYLGGITIQSLDINYSFMYKIREFEVKETLNGNVLI